MVLAVVELGERVEDVLRLSAIRMSAGAIAGISRRIGRRRLGDRARASAFEQRSQEVRLVCLSRSSNGRAARIASRCSLRHRDRLAPQIVEATGVRVPSDRCHRSHRAQRQRCRVVRCRAVFVLASASTCRGRLYASRSASLNLPIASARVARHGEPAPPALPPSCPASPPAPCTPCGPSA